MMLTRVPQVEDTASMPSIAPPGGPEMSPDGGSGTRGPYRRFRWKREGTQDDDEELLTEPRLPPQPGEALRLGARVDVLV